MSNGFINFLLSVGVDILVVAAQKQMRCTDVYYLDYFKCEDNYVLLDSISY